METPLPTAEHHRRTRHLRGPVPLAGELPRKHRRRSRRPALLGQGPGGDLLGQGLRLLVVGGLLTGMTAAGKTFWEDRKEIFAQVAAVRQRLGWETNASSGSEGHPLTAGATGGLPSSGKARVALSAAPQTASAPRTAVTAQSHPAYNAPVLAAYTAPAAPGQSGLLPPVTGNRVASTDTRQKQAAIGPVLNSPGQNLVVDTLNGNSPYAVTASDTFGSVTVGDTMTGTLNHTAGTVTVSNGVILGNGAGSNGTYAFGSSANGQLNAATLTIGKGGMGTMIQGADPFTGNGVALSGALIVGDATGSNGTYMLSGGTMVTSSGSFSYGGSLVAGSAIIGNNGQGKVSLTAGTLFSLHGTGTLTLGNNSGGVGTLTESGGTVFTGPVVLGNSGTGDVTQSGGEFNTGVAFASTAQALTLGVAATGKGSYSLNGGTLVVGSVVRGAGTGIFNFNGGVLQAGASGATFFQGLTAANVQAGGAVIDSKSFTVTVGQDLQHDSAAGAPATDGGLTVTGVTGFGKVTFTGTNTYTGNTTFAGGTLNVGSAGALGTSGPLVFNGGTLQYSAANQTDYSNRFSTGANQLYSVDTNGQDVTFTSALMSSGGSLAKLGVGTLGLNASNNLTGGFNLAGGTLALGSTNALGNVGPLSFTGGTLQYSSENTVDYSARFSTASNQKYSVDTNGQSVTFATGLTSQFGGLTKSGTGTLTLTGTNTYTGPTAVNAGALTVTGGGVGLGSFADSFSVAGDSSANVSGTATIRAANLKIGSGGASTFTQSGKSSVQVSGTVAVGMGGPGTTGTGTYNLQGGALTSQVTTVGGSQNSPQAVFNQSGGAHTTTVLAFNGFQATAVYNLSGGTLTANFFDVYTDPGRFNFNGGTLQAGASNPSFVRGGTTTTVQAGGAKINTNGFDITVGTGLLHDTAAGAPAIDGGLTKLGAGTLNLSGASNYTGPTTVSAGTLIVSGSLGANGMLTVASGGTLSGGGSIAGNVSILNGGKLSLASFGLRMSVSGNLTLAGASTAAFTLGGKVAGTTYYTQVYAGGQIDLGGAALKLSLVPGYVPSVGDKFFLLDTTGSSPVLGTFSNGTTFTQDSVTYQINYADTDPAGATPTFGGLSGAAAPGNDVSLLVLAVAVPEPGTWALLVVGLVALGWVVRRRAQARA